MAEIVFWTSFAVVFHTYVGYPALLVLWRLVGRRPVRKLAFAPTVSIVIAARNERDSIEQKIENCLCLIYPRERVEIIVALDAPTDGTDEIVDRYRPSGIKVVRQDRHLGKAAALNRAVRVARGDILVFTDARQELDLACVRELAANFGDPEIGAVSGELILNADGDGEGVGIYWKYEKFIRKAESDIHSIPGATGALYAIRRDLYREIPAGTILDDVAVPMGAVLEGRRVIIDGAARAYDRTFPADVEYRRKVRTLYGNYQLIAQMPELLVPWRNPIFLQFVSHKVGRLVAPIFLILLLISNLFLVHGFYAAVLAMQSAWYALAGVGLWMARRERGRARETKPQTPAVVADERKAA